MTSCERMLTALRNQTPDVVPTFLCYHGMYANRHTTLDYLLEYRRRIGRHTRYPLDPGEDLGIRRWAIEQTIDLLSGRIDHQFVFPSIRTIVCDVMTRQLIDTTIRYLDTEDVLIIGEGDHVRVEGREPRGNWDRSAPLATTADVDRYFEQVEEAASPPPPADPGSDPYADLRAKHRAANENLFRCGSFPTPLCSAIGAFGYQGAMLAMHDRPQILGYFIERVTGQHSKAIHQASVDGFWFDEYYTDVISPKHYDEFVWRPNMTLAQALRESGKASIYYFCGDICPRLQRLLTLDVDAIAFEESKKGFHVDIEEIAEVVGHRKALCGNMDGLHLLPRGTPAQIATEVKRQLRLAGRDGGFIMGAGSPVAPDTPLKNMRTFLEATRQFGRYPKLSKSQ